MKNFEGPPQLMPRKKGAEDKKENQPKRLQQELNQIKEAAIADGKLFYNETGEFEYALAPNGEKSHLDEKQWMEIRSSFFKGWFGDWERFEELKRKQEKTEDDKEELKKLEQSVSKMVDENGEPIIVYHGTQIEFEIFLLNNGSKGFSGNYFAKELEKVLDYAGLVPSPDINIQDKEKFRKENYQSFVKEIKQMIRQNKVGALEEVSAPVELVYQYRKKNAREMAQQFKQKYKETVFFWMKKKYLSLFKRWVESEREIRPVIIEAYLKSVNPLIIDNQSDGRDGNWGNFESDVQYAKRNSHDGIVWLRTYDGGPTGTVLNVFDPGQIKSAQKNNGFFASESNNIYE